VNQCAFNGLPVVTVELKNPLTGQRAEDACKQYMNDRDGRDPLFRFKMMHLRGVPSGFLSTLDAKLTCRVMVIRLAAYREALSGFMLELG
jgi:hypothetical protein